MSRPRLYLLTVISPALQREHMSILEAVKHHSDGDYVEVFKQSAGIPGAKASGGDIPFTVAYMFSATTHPREMGFGLLDRDAYLLVEVTGLHEEQRLSVAHNWLKRHPGS